MVSILLLLLFLILFFYKRKVLIYSPVDIFIIFYSIVVFSTILYQYFVPSYLKFNLYNFDDISNIRFKSTLSVFVNMIIFFLVGTFFYKFFNPYQSKKESIEIKKVAKKQNIKINNTLLLNTLIIVMALSLILVFLDYGEELFSRPKYLPNKASTFKTIYQVLFILVSFLSGILFHKNNFISFSSILLTIIVGLSMGSRFASVYLIIFGITYSISLSSKKRRTLFLLVFIPFVILFFGFNISLRSETNVHGLIPYMKVLYEKPHVVYEYALKNIYYSVIFGFYATADTIKVYTFYSWSKLITCLNPLPGRMTNWYLIDDKMRSNIYAPFTAIGELAKFKIFFLIYYLILGYYFSFVESFVKRNFRAKQYFLSIIQILILTMFVIFSFEYNLRSSNRYIYYSIFLFVCLYVLKKLSIKKISNETES